MDSRRVKAQAIVMADQFGLSVIPLVPGKKKPCVSSWRDAQERLATVDEIAAWKQCNVGLVTGSLSGVVVIDCESREDAAWFWKNRGQSSVIVETPRGLHLYFKHPGGFVGNRTKVKDEQGRARFDVRGDGGYVVAPPSEVVADGEDVKVSGVYRFRRGFELRHPETMNVLDVKWIPAPVSSASSVQRSEIRNIEAYISKIHAVSGQGGHNETYKVVCRMKESGLSEAEALFTLQAWNRTNAEPPWSDAELLHKVRSVYGGEK